MMKSGKSILWLALPGVIAAGIIVFGICGIERGGNSAPISRVMRHGVRPYTPPVPPFLMTDAGERADYLSRHYWDAFPMTDTAYIGAREITEQALVGYLRILSRASFRSAAEGLNLLLDKALDGDVRMFARFAHLLEHYLYEPGSPMRNDRLYTEVLRHIVASPRVGGIYKIRPTAQLEMVLKNRVGDTASDFAYTLYDGTKGSLHTLRAEYTLLVFYDPDCPGCRETIGGMSGSPVLKFLSADPRKLTVLAVYTGKDTGLWRRHRGEWPESWAVCRDAGGCTTSGRLYDLRAVPALYLLDKDKRVILKDVGYEAVESWLETNAIP